MIEPVTTDALLQAWYQATEDRRVAALAELKGKEHSKDVVIEGTLTISQAATRAKTSRPTVYRAIESGVLSARPLYPGGRNKIREQDFRAWILGGTRVI